MNYFKAVILFALGLTLIGVQVRANLQQSQARRDMVASWNEDESEIQFSTSGISDTTLVLSLSENSPVSCDARMDNIMVDSKLVSEIQRQGFTALRCGKLEQTFQTEGLR